MAEEARVDVEVGHGAEPARPGITSCPSCGEAEALSGRPVAGDIEISCAVCRTTWLRGDPRCKGCGGTAGVAQRQLMTRTPRGNQLAVVGHREVTLCPSCDEAALAATHASALPESYVSVFLFGRRGATPARPRMPSGEALGTGRQVGDPRTDDDRESVARAAPAPSEPTPPHPTPPHPTPPHPTPPHPTPPHLAPPQPTVAIPVVVPNPTARQAIEAYLTAVPGGDSLTMLMLGRHLGSSRRLRDLEDPAEGERLSRWLDETWGTAESSRREAARTALRDVLAYWQRQGWVGPELASSFD